MTTAQKQDLANFKAAKQIALTIEENFHRRASAEADNPFYGANLKGLGTVVIWPENEQHLTYCVPHGTMEMDGTVWCFKRVAEWTILS